MEKGRESPSLIKDGKLHGASLRTMCQLLQFLKNLIPDVPSKASGDRPQLPSAQAPGDQSHKAPEFHQPFKEDLSGELLTRLTHCRGAATSR